MNYAHMSESALLRKIVTEELYRFEAHYGKAVCPKAKSVFTWKILRLILLLLLMIAGIVALFSSGINLLSSPYSVVALFVVIIMIPTIRNRNLQISMDNLAGSMNPVVHYVMLLAKKNPDQKIRDIIYLVCENAGARVNPEYMDEMATSLNGVSSPYEEQRAKRIHIAVGIILVLCLIGVAGYYMIPRAGYEEVSDGYMLKYYNQGFSLDGQAVIPSQYNGKPVVAIDSGAFKGDLFLKSVTLPDTIVRIGGEAFQNCRRLESINIPDGVVELRGNTFEGCSSLKYVEIPDSVVEIHAECFRKCKKLTGIHLSSNITEIKGNAFEYCTSLQSVEIPYGVTRIAGHAFYGCSSLSQVTVPATVVSIGSSAFRQCDSLYEITLPVGVEINERAFKESPTTIYFY